MNGHLRIIAALQRRQPDLGDFKRRYGGRICLRGNVNCTGPLQNGPIPSLVDEVKRCIAAAAAGGGYILSSSNIIHSGVPAADYSAMLKALRQHGCYA